MYTFLFHRTSDAPRASRVVQSSLQRIAGRLPRIGSAPAVKLVELPELGAALGVLTPEQDWVPSLIQVHLDDRKLVVTFGSCAGSDELASTVRNVFERGGTQEVTRMDGSFSALIADREQRRVQVCGTLLGHRALYYHHRAAGDVLSVSPHDLVLLACGNAELEIDWLSLVSSLACDWSLMGRSMLRGVSRCHPLEVLMWRPGLAEKRPAHDFPGAQRIDVRDRAGMARQVEAVVDEVMATVSRRVAQLDCVESGLTAGMDSRATWASLVGACSPRRLVAITSGSSDSLDAKVARRLAAWVGARHQTYEAAAPSTADFSGTSRLLAFFTNGDTSAKRGMTALPRINLDARPHAGGQGGEIFRGFFYSYFAATRAVPRDLEGIADTLVRWRFRRLPGLPFAQPGLKVRFRERLLDTLAFLDARSGAPHDVLDLFYLFERYGCWGSVGARLPWNRNWTPFESVPAIVAAFRLPPPIGVRCHVHAELVRRYLPRQAFWWPVNGTGLIALDGPGRARQLARQMLSGAAWASGKMRRKLRGAAREPDDLRAGFLARELHGEVEDLLESQGSLSRELFGLDAVRRMLRRHRERRDQLATLSILITAEHWRRLAHELSTSGEL